MANVMEKQDALQSVVDKLTAALDGIEQRFDAHMDEFAKRGVKNERQNDFQKEREALKLELNEARQQANKLASANMDVATRLDAVITNLRTVLGKN